MKEDHRSFKRNFRSCDKKALKNSGLYGIRKLYLLRYQCSARYDFHHLFITSSSSEDEPEEEVT